MQKALYKIVISPPAQKEIEDLPKSVREWVLRDIHKKLTESPIDFGKPLVGQLKGCYRLRVNNYRVIYRIAQEVITVYVIKVDHRKDVYD